MANIKLLDFTKDVELNRKRLIQNVREKGGQVSDTASLSSVVTANNNIPYEGAVEHPNQHEVRWFDGDGTLLKTEWVDHGGTATPPEENPNLDPERLTFKEWVSAIGRYDNIITDMDYGATYTINDHSFHLFCNFTDYTGLSPTIKVACNNTAGTVTIDWGDGKSDTHEYSNGSNIQYDFSHIYDKAGEYEIIISHSKENIDFSSNSYYWIYSYNYNNSYSMLGDANLDLALVAAYFPIVTSHSFYNTKCLKHIITEQFHGGYIKYFETIILPNGWNFSSNDQYIYIYKTKLLIFSNNSKWSSSSSVNIEYGGYYLDKLILPELQSTRFALQQSFYLKKLISYAYSNSVSGNVYSITYAGRYVKDICGSSSLKELVIETENDNFNISTSGFYFGYLNDFSIPDTWSFTTTYALNFYTHGKYLTLPKEFDRSFTMHWYADEPVINYINWLNNIKDASDIDARTIKFENTPDKTDKFLSNYAKLNDFTWELCSKEDDSAMTLLEAFNTKNWTISFS